MSERPISLGRIGIVSARLRFRGRCACALDDLHFTPTDPESCVSTEEDGPSQIAESEIVQCLARSLHRCKETMRLVFGSLLLWSATVRADFTVSSVESSVPLTEFVQYACTFVNLWNPTDHALYPEDAHWSPMVVVPHNDDYSMWAPGAEASPGVQNVAETGSRTQLITEINIAEAGPAVAGSSLFLDEGQEEEIQSFFVDDFQPLVSAITMVAPSPDWFTGFYDLDLRSGDVWLESFVVETFPWDAGTAVGENFAFRGGAEDDEDGVITRILANTTSTGVFVDPTNSTILPVARWECGLVDPPSPSPTNVPTTPPTTPPPVEAPVECMEGRMPCGANEDCCSGLCLTIVSPSVCTRSRSSEGGGGFESIFDTDGFRLNFNDRVRGATNP